MRHRSIKVLLAYFALAAVFGLGLYSETRWRSCSGVSDCYFSWRLFWGKGDIAIREKELLISHLQLRRSWLCSLQFLKEAQLD
jgi:hypothetical protein